MFEKLPNDLIENIGSKLTFMEYTTLVRALNMNISDELIFTHCSLFSTENNLKQTLILYGILPTDLYKTIINSSYDVTSVIELFDNIVFDKICNKKQNYNIVIDYQKTSPSHVENTITLTKIFLITIEDHIRKRFIINNPYSSVNVMIINTLINYFQVIVCSSGYQLIQNIDKSTFKFNLLLFDSSWYLSNLNIYNLYLLYLLETSTILSDYTNDVYLICNKCRMNSKLQFSNQQFWSEIGTMFYGGKHNEKLKEIMNHCKN
jgi:hypothetical protein